MNKQLLAYLLVALLTFKGQCFATPAPFTSEPLSNDLRTQLVNDGVWKNGCPITMDDLRLLTISFYDFSGKEHRDGKIILNKSVTDAALKSFQTLYTKQFPLNLLSTLSPFKGNWQSAEIKNVSYGFICYQDSKGNYAPESYGTLITINPIQNPEITLSLGSSQPPWCHVLSRFFNCNKLHSSPKIIVNPASGMLSINRGLHLKGMVENIATIFQQNGFSWGGDSLQQINWKKFTFLSSGKTNDQSH